MSLSSAKIILANSSTNTAGAYFQFSNVAATSAGVTIPAGIYQIVTSANVYVQVNTSTNIAAPTWSNITVTTGNAGPQVIISDGTNVQAVSVNAAATLVLLGTNGGQAVSGTYNNK